MKTLSNFEKIAKKNKRSRSFKLMAISVFMALIVMGGICYALEKIARRNGENVMEYYVSVSEIAYPNIDYISWGYQASSYLSGDFYSNRVKDIDGIMVPFETYTASYSILGSDTYNQDERLKLADGGNSHYTYGNQYKFPTFFSTETEGTTYSNRTQDLAFIPKMSGQAVEVAITFDKAYSLSDIEKMIPENLKLNWVWIGGDRQVLLNETPAHQFGFAPDVETGLTVQGQKALEQEIEEARKKDSEADIGQIYDQYVKNHPVTSLEGMENSYRLFQERVETFLGAGYGLTKVNDADGEEFSIAQYLQDYLDANKDSKTATFAGVILTGRAENFAQLENADWIYASNIGQSVEIQPYHQLDK